MFKLEKKKGLNLYWLRKRYCGLLVNFPTDLSPDILKNDNLCSQYDPEEAYDALKSAHAFLTGISNELLENTEAKDEKVSNKLQLIWALLYFCELKEESNCYCFNFQKEKLYIIRPETGKKVSWGWIPKNYAQSFQLISENGCHVEYYKGSNLTENFRTSESGALYFDDRLTALGLKLFFNVM